MIIHESTAMSNVRFQDGPRLAGVDSPGFWEYTCDMAKKKKQTQLDIIKSIRRDQPPMGKTFKVKKNQLFRKQKYKERIDTGGD